MAGRQRSAARGVKAGLTRLRRRRWSSPSMQRMLRRSSSASGPVSMPKSSASLRPGKVVERLRRKTSARLAVEHHRADGRRRQPALGAQLGHARVEVRGRAARDRRSRGPAGRARTAAPWRRNLPRGPGSPGRSAGIRRAMDRVDLGPLRVSRLCLGTMLMGGRTPADEAPRLLDAYVAAGHNFLDTADVYGDGDLRAARWRRGSRAGATRSWWRPSSASPSPIPAGRASRPSAIVRGVRRLAAAAGDRRHRPLPGPRARPRRRAGGHAGGARRPRARRQGARARRLELPRLAAGVGGRASRTARASPPSSRCSRSTRSSSARSRPRSCPSAAPPGSGCCRGARSAPASSPAATSATPPPPAGTRIGDADGRPRGGAAPPRHRGQLPRRRRGARRRRRARGERRAGRDRLAAGPAGRHRADPRPAHARAARGPAARRASWR